MNKTISFMDTDREKIVQYKCKLTDEAEHLGVHKFLYGLYNMDFNQKNIETCILKDHIINEFYKLLDDRNNVIDFRKLMSLFNKKKLQETDTVYNLIKKFLGLFTFEKVNEYSMKDICIMQIFIRHPTFKGTDEAKHIKKVLLSISGNTKLLNNDLINRYINVSTNANLSEEKIKKKVNI